MAYIIKTYQLDLMHYFTKLKTTYMIGISQFRPEYTVNCPLFRVHKHQLPGRHPGAEHGLHPRHHNTRRKLAQPPRFACRRQLGRRRRRPIVGRKQWSDEFAGLDRRRWLGQPDERNRHAIVCGAVVVGSAADGLRKART